MAALNNIRVDGAASARAPRARPSPKRRRWIWLACAPIVLLLAAEGATRLLWSEPPHAEGLSNALTLEGNRYRLVPGSRLNYDGQRVEINAAGFRGAEAPAGLIRVALVGGDTVFGSRTPGDSGQLTELIDESLNRHSTRFQVMNLGVPRLSSEGMTARVEEALKAGAAAVIIFVGYEDVARLVPGAPHATLPAPTVAAGGWPSSSALYRWLTRTDASPSAPIKATAGSDETLRGEALRRVSVNLQQVIRACRASRTGLLILSEPSLATSAGENLIRQRDDLARGAGMTNVTMLAAFQDLRDRIAIAAGARRDIWFHDLAGDMAAAAARDAIDEAKLYDTFDRWLGLGLTPAGARDVAARLEIILRDNSPWLARMRRGS